MTPGAPIGRGVHALVLHDPDGSGSNWREVYDCSLRRMSPALWFGAEDVLTGRIVDVVPVVGDAAEVAIEDRVMGWPPQPPGAESDE